METAYYLTRKDFVRAKEALEKAQVPELNYVFIIDDYLYIETEQMIQSYNDFISTYEAKLGSAQCIPVAQPKSRIAKYMATEKQKEVENTMTTNPERDYLFRRLRDIKINFHGTLTDTYNIYGNNSPKTYQQLIDAIKNGQYTLDTKRTGKIDAAIAADEKPEWVSNGPFDGIVWTLPGGPDQKGFDAAKKSLDKAYQDALDIVQTSDAAAGLKALKDFEAWTYEAPQG